VKCVGWWLKPCQQGLKWTLAKRQMTVKIAGKVHEILSGSIFMKKLADSSCPVALL